MGGNRSLQISSLLQTLSLLVVPSMPTMQHRILILAHHVSGGLGCTT